MSGLAVRGVQLQHVYNRDGESVIALDGVDLDIVAGSTAVIIGPSGSGKSTLMSLLAGLQRPTAGELFIGEDDLASVPDWVLLRARAERLGVVVQGAERNLLAYGDAEDNIHFAQRGARSYSRRELPDPRQLLRDLGLDHLAGVRVDRLSGGERQRIALAVGIANAPGLLLADEPTSQLDTVNRDRVTDLLIRINERFESTVITVTHDPEVAARFEQTVTLHEGRVVREGPSWRP